MNGPPLAQVSGEALQVRGKSRPPTTTLPLLTFAYSSTGNLVRDVNRTALIRVTLLSSVLVFARLPPLLSFTLFNSRLFCFLLLSCLFFYYCLSSFFSSSSSLISCPTVSLFFPLYSFFSSNRFLFFLLLLFLRLSFLPFICMFLFPFFCSSVF